MKATLDRVTHDALEMSPHERAALAHALLVSMDEVVDQEVDQAWNAEIERRVGEIQSGKVQGVPAPDVFTKLKAKYSQKED